MCSEFNWGFIYEDLIKSRMHMYRKIKLYKEQKEFIYHDITIKNGSRKMV